VTSLQRCGWAWAGHDPGRQSCCGSKGQGAAWPGQAKTVTRTRKAAAAR
jgi:hypothetical protein